MHICSGDKNKKRFENSLHKFHATSIRVKLVKPRETAKFHPETLSISELCQCETCEGTF